MSIYTRQHSVYIMTVPSGFVKVGISDDPDRRLKEVQSYFYERVEIDYSTLISGGSPVSGLALEQLIHQKLKPFAGKRREWFRIDADDALMHLLLSFRFLAMPIGHSKIGEMVADFSGQISKRRRRALAL